MSAVTTTISPAFERMQRILFEPFKLGNWFALGFSAFLASLAGGFNFNLPTNFNSNNDLPSEAGNWMHEHMAAVILIGAVLVVIVLAVGILCVWLGSRGRFMFLDNLVHDRYAVKEPWHRFREPANRLFGFTLATGFVAALFIGVVAALGVGAAFLIKPHFDTMSTWSAVLLITALVMLGAGLLLSVIAVLAVLHDLVPPIMYFKGFGPVDASRYLWTDLLRGRGWLFTKFYLMKGVLGLAGVTVVMMAGCLTCCIGFLPYLSSVLSLPVSVFLMHYTLEFLGQVDGTLRV